MSHRITIIQDAMTAVMYTGAPAPTLLAYLHFLLTICIEDEDHTAEHQIDTCSSVNKSAGSRPLQG